jgi:hypothetical protein
VKCASCQRDIADGSNFCPYCGNVQPTLSGGTTAGVPSGSVGIPSGSVGIPGGSLPGGPTPGTGASYGSGIPTYGSTPGGGAGYGGAGTSTGAASSRASLALGLGIGSLVMDALGCCCYGVPSLIGIGLGIAAFVVGRNELEDIAGGLSSAGGQGQANAGKLLGIGGAILGLLVIAGYIVLLAFVILNPDAFK